MASTTTDLILRYRAETDELTRELNAVIDKQEQLQKEVDDTNKSTQKAVTVETSAAKAREQLIAKELKNIQALKAARERASDPKIINKFNAAIAESERNIATLGTASVKSANQARAAFESATGRVQNLGRQIAAGVVAAFGVQQIIAFGKQSVDAFLDAQKGAEALRNAIVNINGESEQAFNKLIKQSEELQAITVFSDDDIQRAQSALAAFGLTSDAIEELLPKLADFATVSGQDIAQAAEQVGAGLEGAGREFKKYGIEVSATNTRLENLNEIIKGFSKFQGSATTAAQSFAGQLQRQRNAIDDMQESIGQKLLPTFLKLQQAGLRIVKFFADLFGEEQQSDFQIFSENLQKTNVQAQASIQVLINGNLPLEQRRTLIDQINQQYGEYLPALITEKTTTEELIRIQQELNQNILDRIRLMALEEQIAEITERAVNAARNLIQIEKERAKVLKETETTSAQFIKTQTDLFRVTGDINRQILADAPKQIAELQEQYNKLFNSLGLTVGATKNLTDANGKLADSDARVANSLEDINAVAPITSLAYQNLTQAQRDLITLFEASQKGAGEFRDEVQKLSLALESKSVEEFELKLKKLNDERLKAGEAIEPAPIPTKSIDDYSDHFILKNQEILQSSVQLFHEISALSFALTDSTIHNLERQLQASNDTFDQQQQALETSFEKRLISEADYRKRSDAIEQQRIANEKKIQAEINKVKRRQAQLNKVNALFEIALNTAVAITNALSQGNVPLAAVVAAIGAAQTATVAAQPIPGFKKGTKGKKEDGLAWIAEDGRKEAVFLPQGTKVVPNKPTVRYADAIDAMIDNRYDQYILKKHITPALLKQKKEFEKQEKATFASNIVNSMTYQGITFADMMHVNKKGIKITNVKELAQELAKILPSHQINLTRL